jgi:hypothetical protein
MMPRPWRGAPKCAEADRKIPASKDRPQHHAADFLWSFFDLS